jgi:beta-phosphoglucomutase-like phosphatase (HAD superfamily)
MRIQPAFLFDLDGTLVDSVYQHVLAWKHALDAEGIELSVWRIHRKMPAFPGQSQPAAAWKPQPSIWPRSASIRIGFPW